MREFNVGVLAVAGSALVLGLLSKPLKRYGVPDSVVLLLLGVALGPNGFALLRPESWGDPMAILEQVCRLALAVGLMGVALRLPKEYVRDNWRSVAVVLVFVMPFMWLTSSLVVGTIFGFSLGAALLVGAILTPTDPVVASAVVTGPVAEENLPAYLRHIISAESGANDGLAYLFAAVGIFMLTLTAEESLSINMLHVFLGKILGAIALGIAAGYLAGVALRKAEERNLIEQPSILMISTALALTVLAGVKLIGSDGILAVFAAGIAFDWQVDARERQQEARVTEGVDRFFTSPVFILLGLLLPVSEWLALGWSLCFATLGVLVFRRLPVMVVLAGRTRDLPTQPDALFAGWFGPIGVAALYYAIMAQHRTELPELWPLVSFAVVASIVVHGFSATPFSHLYRRGAR
ncbi:cation:proton antiporter domain-containing protein [Gilvimarinus sp. F26214L]|uniref:cation:proton antiporter domain-containing protein n=1 Tax=Gilvimarinus sp. DZF01 TaxID=3461371 RepID=UPI0040453542